MATPNTASVTLRDLADDLDYIVNRLKEENTPRSANDAIESLLGLIQVLRGYSEAGFSIGSDRQLDLPTADYQDKG